MNPIAFLAVLAAYIAKGMTGFANTLIFGTIMSFTADNIAISPLDLIVGYPSNVYIAWKERKSVSLKICGALSLLDLLGCALGVLFLKVGDVKAVKILFGFAVVFIGAETLFRDMRKPRGRGSRKLLLPIGFVSGILSGLFGIGAFLVAYIDRTTENRSQFRGNLCFVFAVEATFRAVLYAATGILTVAILKQALILLPFMAAGFALGVYFSNRVKERAFKKVVAALLILSGISLAVANLVR
jgi:uncharacterized membrane protein YfcA